MDLKFSTVCLVILATVNAGFLNLGQNNGGNGDGSLGGTYDFQQQVPLSLNPGPVAQSSQSQAAPHASAAISASFVNPSSSQNQGSSSQTPIASSATYRLQHVNSVPATITTHGVAAGYVGVPAHGFFNDNGANNINERTNAVAPGNNNGGLSAGYGYGSYGYTFSAAGGNSGSQARNHGNNGRGVSYSYIGNDGPSSVSGFSV